MASLKGQAVQKTLVKLIPCQFSGPENGVTYNDSERSLKYAESSAKGVQMGLKIGFVESSYMKQLDALYPLPHPRRD